MIHRALERIPGAEVLRRPETREAAGPEPLDWRSLPEPGEPGFEEMVRDRHARVRGLDHFSRLGLQRDAGRDEIKRAFFGAAKRFHPDRLPPAALPLKREIQAIFAALNESYQLLQDDQRRQRYLDELEGHSTGNHAVREFEAEVAAAFQRRDFATAQRILADALEIEERPDLRAHLLWARQSERPELTAQVREELGRLVAQHERCASAHYYLGVLARVAGETDVADRRFRAVLDILPTHREAQRELELLALRRAEPQRPRRW